MGNYKDIEHKYIGGSWPKQRQTVEPDLIVWKNLGIGKIGRFGRALCTYMLSFFIILLGFSVIVLMISKKDSINKSSALCGTSAYSFD